MKKLTFSIFAATLAFGANASVEPAAAANCCAYDGLFFGLGISAVDSGVKTETTAVTGVGDNGTDHPGPSGSPNDSIFYKKDDVKSIDHDLGIDTHDHDTRFTANAILGYGKRIQEKAYVAIEAGLDAGQNSNFCHVGMSPDGGKKFDVFSKNNGLIPSVGLRLGYVHPETKSLVFLKAGAAYSQARATYEDSFCAGYAETPSNDKADDPLYDVITYSGKCSKWTPIVALGFEKVTGKNFRTRAEVEYRFQTTKSFDFTNGGKLVTDVDAETDGLKSGDFAGDYNGTIKIYNKAAITLRVMGIYTVK